MATEEVKKAQENTLRVAMNLQTLLNDKDVLAPTKYAVAILESQQFVEAFIKDLKSNMDNSKLEAAPSPTVELVKP